MSRNNKELTSYFKNGNIEKDKIDMLLSEDISPTNGTKKIITVRKKKNKDIEKEECKDDDDIFNYKNKRSRNTNTTIIMPFFGSFGNDYENQTSEKQKNNEDVDINTVDDCKNPACNHKTSEQDSSPPPEITITKIQTIDDLMSLGRAYHCKKQQIYRGLNLRLMFNLVGPLNELNNMIGMNDVKKHVINQILFFLQGLNTTEKCNNCHDCLNNLPCVKKNPDMMHTIITGPPGVGKTCLGRIMGKIYNAMGILSNGKFHEVTRADFVAQYLGQTAIKTQNLIDKCKGGVMFIDEAYSLGSKEQRDSFSKEAMDTLNKNLSDNRDMLCIIAGYEKDLDTCFFASNEGLKRRFTFRYNVKEYDYNDLLDIFMLKVKNECWTIDYNSDKTATDVKNYTDEDLKTLFKENKSKFPYSGGDIETLFLQCKISHGQRIPTIRKCFSYEDFKNGFDSFTNNRQSNKKRAREYRPNMYV